MGRGHNEFLKQWIPTPPMGQLVANIFFPVKTPVDPIASRSSLNASLLPRDVLDCADHIFKRPIAVLFDTSGCPPNIRYLVVDVTSRGSDYVKIHSAGKEVPNEVQVAQFCAVCLEVLRAHPLILGPERTAQLSGPVFSPVQSLAEATNSESHDLNNGSLQPTLLTRPRTFPALPHSRPKQQHAEAPAGTTVQMVISPHATTSGPVIHSVDQFQASSAAPSISSTTSSHTEPVSRSIKSRLGTGSDSEYAPVRKHSRFLRSASDDTQIDGPGTASGSGEPEVDHSRPIISIHCTHGYNRTGYFIVRFLVDVLGMDPESAYAEFARARPPGIYEEYIIAGLRAHYGLDPHSSLVVRPPTPDWLKGFERERQKREEKWNKYSRVRADAASTSSHFAPGSESLSPNAPLQDGLTRDTQTAGEEHSIGGEF